MRDLTPEHRADRDHRTRWMHEHRERQLDRDLARLPELVALVDATLTGVRRSDGGARPTPGSRPPLSVHAVTLADRRTRQDDPDVIGTSDLDRLAGRRDGIEPTVRSWVLLAEGEMLDDGTDCAPIPDRQQVAADCAWLARHIVWVREQQWVRELADTLRRMVSDCEAHLRIRPEYRPRCQREGCGGTIRDEGSGLWRCDTCDHTAGDLKRLSLRELVAREKPMTVAELVRGYGLSAKTIESWVARGHLQPVEEGVIPRRFHLLDVLRLADSGGASTA